MSEWVSGWVSVLSEITCHYSGQYVVLEWSKIVMCRIGNDMNGFERVSDKVN